MIPRELKGMAFDFTFATRGSHISTNDIYIREKHYRCTEFTFYP